MTIGELSERSGLTRSRIRFYERIDLLRTVERRPNGYRTYSPQAMVMVDLIATAQQVGFSLDEIRMLLPPDLEHWNHGPLMDMLRAKVADLGALEARLVHSKAQLLSLIAEIEAKPDDMDCATNSQRVLSRWLGNDAARPTLATGDVRQLAKVGRRRSGRTR